jgi:hypothetical protein
MSGDREDAAVRREELAATIEARRELGAELEPHVIDAFVERIERRIDERSGARTPADQWDRNARLALAIVSLGVSIPLLGIAAGVTGLAGVIVVCITLVLVNVIFARFR